MAAAFAGVLPTFLWVAYASAYLFSSRSASWIDTPDFALLEDTLARALGPWSLPKLAVLALVLLAVRRWGFRQLDNSSSSPGVTFGLPLSDASALIPLALMVLGVVALSFVKPMAFSRYFVVLLPALIPWLALRGALLPLNHGGRDSCCWWGSSLYVCGGSNPFLA